jgi:hypothetical protein
MTDTTTAPDVVHLVQLFRQGRRYRAECSCCWVSDWFRSPAAADDAGREHRDLSAGQPHDLDQLTSVLLDLQDDMSEIVVWLAENWSADLPVPVAYGTGGGTVPAGVQLSVECNTTDDLTRVAHLLDAPVADLEHSDPIAGLRFQYTGRDFGRVHVEAYTPAGRDRRP